jgi:CRP-like cAMP-binding protein
MDSRELLAGIGLFQNLNSEEIALLLEFTTSRRLITKETLFQKGDTGNQLYGVLSGRLKAMAPGRDGKELVFAVMGPGDVIGEIAVVDSEPRSATVVALEKSELLCLDRRDLLPFLEDHPRAAIGFATVLARRVRRLSSYAEDAFFLPLASRMARTLLVLAGRDERGERTGLLNEVRFAQQDLADMLGTTRESVNKQLRSWEEQGLVELSRGRMRVRDSAGLSAVADWEGL